MSWWESGENLYSERWHPSIEKWPCRKDNRQRNPEIVQDICVPSVSQCEMSLATCPTGWTQPKPLSLSGISSRSVTWNSSKSKASISATKSLKTVSLVYLYVGKVILVLAQGILVPASIDSLPTQGRFTPIHLHLQWWSRHFYRHGRSSLQLNQNPKLWTVASRNHCGGQLARGGVRGRERKLDCFNTVYLPYNAVSMFTQRLLLRHTAEFMSSWIQQSDACRMCCTRKGL